VFTVKPNKLTFRACVWGEYECRAGKADYANNKLFAESKYTEWMLQKEIVTANSIKI